VILNLEGLKEEIDSCVADLDFFDMFVRYTLWSKDLVAGEKCMLFNRFYWIHRN
jgi:hypothetical protein